jgi:hypothetical protein
MRDLFIDARLLLDTVRELDRDVDGDVTDLDASLWCLVLIDDALRDLAGVKRILENKVGSVMPAKRYVLRIRDIRAHDIPTGPTQVYRRGGAVARRA